MRLAVHLDSGYEFDENTRIFFNGVDVTGQGHNTIGLGFDWGGYVYIDLGNVDIGEPVYTVVYDYNGGTKNGERTVVSMTLEGNEEEIPIEQLLSEKKITQDDIAYVRRNNLINKKLRSHN